MPVLVVDRFEVVHVDHQACDRLAKTLRPCQLLTQARIQIAPVVEAGEKVSEAAAHEPRAIRRVLEAQGCNMAEVGQEIAREVRVEAERVGAREQQYAFQLVRVPQRNQCNAAKLARDAAERLVVAVVRAEPGLVELRELRQELRQGVDELYFRQVLEHRGVAPEQVTQLVLRVGQRERDQIELVRRPQPVDEALEQLRKGGCTQQLELSLLGLAQQGIVTGGLLGELGEAGQQLAVLFSQILPTP